MDKIKIEINSLKMKKGHIKEEDETDGEINVRR
jgi:hypothetical protein